MKTTITFIILILVQSISTSFSAKNGHIDHTRYSQELNIENVSSGDIIFQVTESSQCKAVQLATHSKYSHCGIIFKEGNIWYVYEAVQPVQKTPLSEWILHGQNKHFVNKRLRNAKKILTPDIVLKMKNSATKYIGKNYDIYFEWSNEKIYCSELVWKIYNQATGLEVGKLQKLKDFDLTSSAVKSKLKERYGDHIPFEELVISPAAIFDCELLYTVQ